MPRPHPTERSTDAPSTTVRRPLYPLRSFPSALQVVDGVQRYGVAPGARVMMDMEQEAAEMAAETGLYVTWRSRNGTDCTRVGPRSKCFCGHTYSDHVFISRKSVYPTCQACTCRAFAFIPQR